MKRVISRVVVGSVVVVMLSAVGLSRASAHQEAAHPAHIQKGTCAALGDVVAPLSDVSAQSLVDGVVSAGTSPVGQANPVETDVSVTQVKMALSDIVAGKYAIDANKSADEIGSTIACGEVGGTMIGTSDLAVALRSLDGSGESGVAYLHDNDNGTTTVTLMLVKGQAQQAVAPAASTVDVTLDDFMIQSSVTTFKAGQTYTFLAMNKGKATHELVIEHSGDVDQPLPNQGGVAEAPDIASESSGTLTFTFPAPGKYQLACHEPGHYEAGMVLQIDVTS